MSTSLTFLWVNFYPKWTKIHREYWNQFSLNMNHERESGQNTSHLDNWRRNFAESSRAKQQLLTKIYKYETDAHFDSSQTKRKVSDRSEPGLTFSVQGLRFFSNRIVHTHVFPGVAQPLQKPWPIQTCETMAVFGMAERSVRTRSFANVRVRVAVNKMGKKSGKSRGNENCLLRSSDGEI